MKYDTQITELKNLLPSAKSVLIAIPSGADSTRPTSTDRLASALALFLILESQGKEVSVICDDDIKVASGHLFGIDHISKTFPKTDGGNLTLTLEGVAASDNSIPALEKLDWYAEGNNLNLVFHVLSGQTFQPAKIVPHYQGSGFNLIFALGALNLNALGNIYQQNQASFSGTHIVNVDNQVGNTSFGQTNVLDSQASSLSEIMVNLISDLGLNLDADAASNLLSGIFETTRNLSDKATADTFMAVASCLRVGGKKPNFATDVASRGEPGIAAQPVESPQPAFDWSALMPQAQPTPVASENVDTNFTVPQIVSSEGNAQPMINPMDALNPSQFSGSPEERPSGEGVISETPEPDWLTPKIFKGSSIG